MVRCLRRKHQQVPQVLGLLWKGQEPDLVFEDIDTRLMKPRPRLYGLVGGEVIEEVWKQRSRSKEESAPSKPAAAKQLAGSV
jgi:hypothetical protein